MTDTAEPTAPVAQGPVDTYGIVFPNAWHELSVDRSELATQLVKLKADWSTRDGWTKTMGRQLDLSAARLSAGLDEMRAALAATYVTAFDHSDAARAEPDLVSATCIVGTLTNSDFGTNEPLSAPTLVVAGNLKRGSDDDAVDLEPPSVVLLPAGAAARFIRHQSVRVSLGETAAVFTETYLVPHAPESDKMCILTFSTPNTELAQDFSPLFARIAGTLRLFREGEPTIV